MTKSGGRGFRSASFVCYLANMLWAYKAHKAPISCDDVAFPKEKRPWPLYICTSPTTKLRGFAAACLKRVQDQQIEKSCPQHSVASEW